MKAGLAILRARTGYNVKVMADDIPAPKIFENEH